MGECTTTGKQQRPNRCLSCKGKRCRRGSLSDVCILERNAIWELSDGSWQVVENLAAREVVPVDPVSVDVLEAVPEVNGEGLQMSEDWPVAIMQSHHYHEKQRQVDCQDPRTCCFPRDGLPFDQARK